MLLVSITAVALALRLWGITFGLPHTLARPDEEKVVSTAIGMLTRGPNPHFFNYPTLYMYLLTAAFGAGSSLTRAAAGLGWCRECIVDASQLPRLHLIARLLTAVLGAATVPLLFVSAKRLFGRDVALVAAAFLAVAYLHVRDSHFGVTDVPATFMTVLAFCAIVTSTRRRGDSGKVAFAAILCGLAAATKYNAAVIVVPLAAVATQEWIETHRWLRPIGMLVLIAVCSLIGFSIGSPYSWIEFSQFRRELGAESAHLAIGHVLPLGFGWSHHLTHSLFYGLGWPLLVVAVAGLAAAAFRYRAEAVVLLPAPLIYYAAIGSGRTVFARYMVPIVPFLCLSAALATVVGARAVASIFRMSPRKVVALMWMAAAAIAGYSTARSIAFDRLVSRPDTRIAAAQWLDATYPQGATVYQTGLSYSQLQLPPKFIPWAYDPRMDPMTAAPERLPALVVVPMSPLTLYTPITDLAKQVLAARYRLLTTFEVEVPEHHDTLVYDEQDAFFAPLSGFARLRRPGPAIEIFERR